MSARTASTTLAIMLLVGALAGCTPTPEPVDPTPSFSSEEAAFAAAEETYRAYVDALNDVDLSDPETFEGVYAWTTGDANAGERKSLSEMHANDWRVQGRTQIESITPTAYHPSDEVVVTLQVCSDVSAVEVLDQGGESVVAPDRPAHQSSVVSLTPDASTQTGMLISEIEGSDASCGL